MDSDKSSVQKSEGGGKKKRSTTKLYLYSNVVDIDYHRTQYTYTYIPHRYPSNIYTTAQIQHEPTILSYKILYHLQPRRRSRISYLVRLYNNTLHVDFASQHSQQNSTQLLKIYLLDRLSCRCSLQRWWNNRALDTTTTHLTKRIQHKHILQRLGFPCN